MNHGTYHANSTYMHDRVYIHDILLMVVAMRVNCIGSDGIPSPAPVDATTMMKYDPGSNPVITSLLSVALTIDERITIVDDSLITHTVYITNIPLINSGGSHDTLIELKETLSTVTFLVAVGTAKIRILCTQMLQTLLQTID